MKARADEIEHTLGPRPQQPCHNDLLNANFIRSPDGIRIESAKAFTLKAGTEAKWEAGTSFAATGGTELALEGGTTAELSGGATTRVVGGLVQIN